MGWMTEQEFAEKVDSEGGIFSALEYGLSYTDLEDATTLLAERFRDIEESFRSLGSTLQELEEMLEDVRNEDDD